MITVVGAGFAGLACARTLADAGADVQILERTGRVGGRAARTDCPPIGRRVEWGAAYLTECPFVPQWIDAGLLQPWTDTFALAGPGGFTGEATGPMRYRAPAGLRSLARNLAVGLSIEPTTVEKITEGILAMPRPQAACLLPSGPFADDVASQPWEAVTVTVAAYRDRTWPDFRAAFVNGDERLALIVDDGDRVGDGAPVLVTYQPGVPTQWPAQMPATDVTADHILDLPEPIWTRSRTWRLAQPAVWDERPFGYQDGLGVIGDGWAGKPRVGAAITSGIALAEFVTR